MPAHGKTNFRRETFEEERRGVELNVNGAPLVHREQRFRWSIALCGHACRVGDAFSRDPEQSDQCQAHDFRRRRHAG
jgi:hypothetical protein